MTTIRIVRRNNCHKYHIYDKYVKHNEYATYNNTRAEGGGGAWWGLGCHQPRHGAHSRRVRVAAPTASGTGRCTLARSAIAACARSHTDPPALQYHETALMKASRDGHAAVVDALLAAGADPKAKGGLVSGWALGAWDDACCGASRAATCHMHGYSVAHVAHGDLTVS